MLIENKYEKVQSDDLHRIINNLNNAKAVITFADADKANHQMIELVMKALSDEFPQVRFFKTETSAEDPFLKNQGLTNLPVTIFVKGKKIYGWFEGLISKNSIRSRIENLLEV
ncbi:MAG: thioredoxin family protein [Saprospiraceae bacterium]